MTPRRARTRKSSIPRYVLFAGVGVLLALCVVAAFLHYRSTLERPDLFTDRIARNPPDHLTFRHIMVYHPANDGKGVTGTALQIPLTSDDPSSLGMLVASAWAERVASACGLHTPEPPVLHFFYDERRIVYLDFDPSFFAACPVGTAGEQELASSLEKTLRANLPLAASLVILSGGSPVTSPWGHLIIPQPSMRP